MMAMFTNYVASDEQASVSFNRNNWEVYDEDHNELDIYTFYEDDKKRLKEVKKNQLLADKLIAFCIKRFNEYNPLKKVQPRKSNNRLVASN